MRRLLASVLLLGFTVLFVSIQNVEVSAEVPSETECRPYIEKAIHELQSHDHSDDDKSQPEEDILDSRPDNGADDDDEDDDEESEVNENASVENIADENVSNEENSDNADDSDEDTVIAEVIIDGESDETNEEIKESEELNTETDESTEENISENQEDDEDNEDSNVSDEIEDNTSQEEENDSEETDQKGDDTAEGDQNDNDSTEEKTDAVENEENETNEDKVDEERQIDEETETESDSAETIEENENVSDNNDENEESNEQLEEVIEEEVQKVTVEESAAASQNDDTEAEDLNEHTEGDNSSEAENSQEASPEDEAIESTSAEENTESDQKSNEAEQAAEEQDVPSDDSQESTHESEEQSNDSQETVEESAESVDQESEENKESDNTESQSFPEDDLLLEYEIPTNLRDRSHIAELLHLDDESEGREKALYRASESILKELKRIYENAIKPLETLYKYRDLSNRHFSDPEIFSKPLVLFMGPWSGGKSTILNYLTQNEYTPHSLRTGAEPSPAYFNILMHGDEPEVLDGTQLAADWTFSGLQKFGQGLEDRLRGQKLPNKLLEKVNIVEIPGILEVRKQVSRLFPFNDACQWFIDRADIIFLVYDPSKLDVGPETEAILDQLKGREYQTRIILNKGDQVKPEELMRVQSALIWNISPLMSSAQPPVMYTTSLWSHPYETGAPVRLLQAQERAFLRDLRLAIDKRIENKIASARRFAVRVRNHAKMVDCYLTTFYNHKTLFGNKKQIADQIIEHPQNYHIYEGLSTLTNISRYDLPDPDVYRDFFRLNNLYDFKKLSETCTYFRGCPINKLDIAIAYDLPELVGKYKKLAETALTNLDTKSKS